MKGNEKGGGGLLAPSVTIQHTSIATGLNASWSEVEWEVDRMAGPRGLMIFTRINQGEIISLSGELKRCLLYLVGNPVIPNKIISIDIRGTFYVPFRVCLYDSVTAGRQ